LTSFLRFTAGEGRETEAEDDHDSSDERLLEMRRPTSTRAAAERTLFNNNRRISLIASFHLIPAQKRAIEVSGANHK
jgi:hypothetical protein